MQVSPEARVHDVGRQGGLGRHVVRRKLHGGIEAEGAGITIRHGQLEGLDGGQVDLADTLLPAQRPPSVGDLLQIRNERGPVDQEQRPAADSDAARRAEIFHEVEDEGGIALDGVLLLDQDLGVLAVPAPGPVLVGPCEAEGRVWHTRAEHQGIHTLLGCIRVLRQAVFGIEQGVRTAPLESPSVEKMAQQSLARRQVRIHARMVAIRGGGIPLSLPQPPRHRGAR